MFLILDKLFRYGLDEKEGAKFLLDVTIMILIKILCDEWMKILRFKLSYLFFLNFVFGFFAEDNGLAIYGSCNLKKLISRLLLSVIVYLGLIKIQ